MLTVFFLLLYVLTLVGAYLGLSCTKSCMDTPSAQVLYIVLIILGLLAIQSFLFSQIYYGIYANSSNSFAGSEAYKTRKQAEAVQSLWLSKDTRRGYFFPNWLLLELSDSLKDAKNLNVFYDAYELHYGNKLSYEGLRSMLSKEYPELLVRISPKPLPQNMPKEGHILDLPDISEFVTRLSSALTQFNIALNTHDKQSPELNKTAFLLMTIYSELSSDVSINRLDVLLDVKSSEIAGILTGNLKDIDQDAVQNEIEKTLFFHLARMMIINADDLPSKLSRSDFWFYSALSFLSANNGDIQPISTWARTLTFVQVLFTFLILAVTISFLGNAVADISRINISTLMRLSVPVCIAVAAVLFISLLVSCFWKCARHGVNASILKSPENYGYAIKKDGTVDLMINVDGPDSSTYLSKHYTLSMPYQAVLRGNIRCPGILITKHSSMIVWAELFAPTADRIYIYGENFNIRDIGEKFKLLVPGTFKAF